MKLKVKFKQLLVILFITIIAFPYNNIYAINEPTIYSKAAIAIDAENMNIIYGKNIDSKVYPASITKIMTAILAIENLDLNETIVVSKTAVQVPWDSSSMYLKVGEIVTVEEVLYGLLLSSGNDAANVLGEAVSGSIDDFVVLMNNKAMELGCTGTNFVNTHGYTHDNHYTTPIDIAKIFSYCVKNETFLKIISTKLYIVDETNKTNEKRYMYNTNRLILTKNESQHARFYEPAIGGKTGYTEQAGRTLVSIAEKDGKKVIMAVFKAGQVNGQDARYTDAISLFEYSFNNYTKTTFANKNEFNYTYTNYDEKLKYNIYLKDDLEILLKNDSEITDVSYKLDLNESLLNSLGELDSTAKSVGTVTFIINTTDNTYESKHDVYLSNITSLALINKSNYTKWITGFVIAFIILTITVIIIIKIKVKPNKKAKHKNIKASKTITTKKHSVRKQRQLRHYNYKE